MRSNINLAQVISNDTQEPQFKDGDGGGGGSDLTSVAIDFALNGYILNLLFEDGTEEIYVFEDFDECIKMIRSRH